MEVLISIKLNQLTSRPGSRKNDPSYAIWPATRGYVALWPKKTRTIGLPSKSRVGLKLSLVRILPCACRTRRFTKVASSTRAVPRRGSLSLTITEPPSDATWKNIHTHGQIVDAVPIPERPAEVEDCVVPGDWQGDLLSGSKSSHIAATLM